METELILSRGGLPPLSARGCQQELSPLALGQFKRTVNGDLVFLGVAGKKYRSIITCEDKTALATDDLAPGVIIDVHCIQRLWQKIKGGEGTLERDYVPGSLIAMNEQRHTIGIIAIDGRTVKLATDSDVFISYRPILKMSVLRYLLKTTEWHGTCGWQLELEEV